MQGRLQHGHVTKFGENSSNGFNFFNGLFAEECCLAYAIRPLWSKSNFSSRLFCSFAKIPFSNIVGFDVNFDLVL